MHPVQNLPPNPGQGISPSGNRPPNIRKSRHLFQTPARVICEICVTLERDLIAEGQHYYTVVYLSITDIRKFGQTEVVAGIDHEVANLV